MKRLWQYITGAKKDVPTVPPFPVTSLCDDHLMEVFRHFTSLTDARNAMLVCSAWYRAYWNMRRVDPTYLLRIEELTWKQTRLTKPIECWKIEQNPQRLHGPCRRVYLESPLLLDTETLEHISCMRDGIAILPPVYIHPELFALFHGQGLQMHTVKRPLMGINDPMGDIQIHKIKEIRRLKITPWVRVVCTIDFVNYDLASRSRQYQFRCATISDLYRGLLLLGDEEFGGYYRDFYKCYENGLLEHLYTWPPFQVPPPNEEERKALTL